MTYFDGGDILPIWGSGGAGQSALRRAVAEHSRGAFVPKALTIRRSSRPVLDFKIERKRLRALGPGAIIVGIDEAGIGPWAGPVVAAAVCLDPRALPEGLADSKLLTPQRREALYDILMACAEVGVGVAEVARIDRDNVLAASHWAMAQATAALARRPVLALIDGRHAPEIGCAAEALVDGDARVASIAAASIIAKVTRDRLMATLALEFPSYGFERHKGYGTQEHRRAIVEFGVCACHRRSFAPVAAALAAAGQAEDLARNNSAALTPEVGTCG